MTASAPTEEKTKNQRYFSESFAHIFRAYLEASDKVQEVIRDMCEIINSDEVDPDEREAAFLTLEEALFPYPQNGDVGIDIFELRDIGTQSSDEIKTAFDELDQADSTFAERLKAAMDRSGISQTKLAELVGVQQPAISMMLNRNCHPQRATVERLASALGLEPEELWPTWNQEKT